MKSNRSKYFFSQAWTTSKKAYLVILSLGISISMVAGLNYFIDSYTHYTISSNFSEVADYEFKFSSKPYTNNFSDFNEYEENINQIAFSQPSLQIQSLSPYCRVGGYSRIGFYKNYSDQNGPFGLDEYLSNFEVTFLSQVIYESEQFQQKFKIIEGTYPQKENEILVDALYAEIMNFSVGYSFNIDIIASNKSINIYGDGSEQLNNLSYSVAEDIKISGLFYMEGQEVLNRHYWAPYYIDQDDTLQFYSENLESLRYADFPIFSYYNQSGSNFNSHFDEIFKEYESGFDFKLNLDRGFIALADKSVDLNKLSNTVTEMQESANIIQNLLPGNIQFRNYYGAHLINVLQEFGFVKIIIQIINVPIMLFALIIGSFAIKIGQKSRLDEFLLLRSHGASSKMIRRQLFFEGLAVGIFSSIVGSILGVGVFFITRKSLLTFISWNNIGISFPIIVSRSSVIANFIIGIIVTQIANIMSLIFISRIRSQKLLSILGSDSMEAMYDEKSIFKKQSGPKNITLEDTPFYSGNREDNSPEILSNSRIINYSSTENSKKSQKIISFIKTQVKKLDFRRKKSLYKNDIKVRKRKIRKWSYVMFPLTLIPYIISILALVGRTSDNDALVSFAELMEEFYPLLIFIFILTPLISVIAIIRFVSKENPDFLGKISRLLTKKFMKENSNLCAINMVRKKQYITAMMLIGIFLSLLSFSNIVLNTSVKNVEMSSNINSGADSKIRYRQIDFNMEYLEMGEESGIDPTFPIQNGTSILDLEKAYFNYTNEDNRTAIKNICSVFISNSDTQNYRVQKYLTNLSAYLEVISEDNKYEAVKNLYSRIESVIEFNKAPDGCDVGIIVTNSFLELFDISIGDFVDFELTYYNPLLVQYGSDNYVAKILDSIDCLPGLYVDSGRWNYQVSQVIDISTLHLNQTMLYGSNFFQLLDLVEPVGYNVTESREMLGGVAASFGIETYGTTFYNSDWDSFSLSSVSIYYYPEFVSVFMIFYVEFIIIGVIISLGIAILLLFLKESDKYNHGILLVRGYGKKGIIKLFLAEYFVLFTLSGLTGLLSGIIPSLVAMKVVNMFTYPFSEARIPIFMNPIEILIIGLIIPVFSVLVYFLVSFFESKKKYVEFFHKF